MQREKRLKQAGRVKADMFQTNQTDGKEVRRPQILGRLSIVVAPYKTGDIVVREGQEDEKSLAGLVKNFIVCYGLKREMFPIVLKSLKGLIENN